jgi:predicted DNA-binding transcriptional regulator AlpA
MGCGSLSQFYRIAKRDGLRIVKTGIRASAVVSSDVDAWIVAKIATVAPVHTSAMGGGHE